MTQRARVLSMLQQRGSVTSWEFSQEGVLRFSARIEELRAEGHNIRTERFKRDGRTLYRYVLQPGLSEAEQRPGPSAPRSVSASESSESLFDLPPSAISAITGKRAA